MPGTILCKMHVFILEQADVSVAQSTGVEELLAAERKAHEGDKGNVSNTSRRFTICGIRCAIQWWLPDVQAPV